MTPTSRRKRSTTAAIRSSGVEKIISGDQRDHTDTALKQSNAAMQRDLAMERSAQQDIEVAKANIRNASENLELAKIMLGYTTLRAPFSGVILTRQTELGEVMQPGTPVVTLADLDHVWLRAYVAETDLGTNPMGPGGDGSHRHLSRQGVSGADFIHRVGGGVHAEERRDAQGARDAGLSNQDRR